MYNGVPIFNLARAYYVNLLVGMQEGIQAWTPDQKTNKQTNPT